MLFSKVEEFRIKYKKSISLLVVCIAILSIFASVVGIFSDAGQGVHEIESFRGELIKIYGKGFTMGAALTAMIISEYLAGVSMCIIEIIMFPMFSLIILYCMILLLKNINGASI